MLHAFQESILYTHTGFKFKMYSLIASTYNKYVYLFNVHLICQGLNVYRFAKSVAQPEAFSTLVVLLSRFAYSFMLHRK